MLSMNEENCGRFKAEFTNQWEKIQDENTQSFTKLYPDYGQMINDNGADLTQFCEYLNWADMTGVTLKGDQDDFDYVRSVYCTYDSL